MYRLCNASLHGLRNQRHVVSCRGTATPSRHHAVTPSRLFTHEPAHDGALARRAFIKRAFETRLADGIDDFASWPGAAPNRGKTWVERALDIVPSSARQKFGRASTRMLHTRPPSMHWTRTCGRNFVLAIFLWMFNFWRRDGGASKYFSSMTRKSVFSQRYAAPSVILRKPAWGSTGVTLVATQTTAARNMRGTCRISSAL